MSHYSSQPKPTVRLRPMLPLLLLVSMIGPLTINIILPSLPGLAGSLGTTKDMAQLTISAYMVTIAMAQLFVGPLSDRIGRRPTLLISASIYTLASLLALNAQSIEVLIAARILQALGATAGMSLSRAVISDVSSRTETARILAYLTATMVIAPMAAPSIGSFLDSTFGWWSIFGFTACLGLCVVALGYFLLQETRPASLDAATSREVIGRSFSLLRNREFLRYALVTATTTASYFTFLGGAPHLVIDVMGRKPAEFGLWLIALGVGYACGNLISGRISARVGLLKLAALGNVMMVLGATLMCVVALLGFNTPIAVFLPAMLVTCANGLVIPSTTASAIQTDPKAAGAASGLLGCMQMLLAATSSYVVALIGGQTALPIALMILGWGLISLVLLPPRWGASATPRSG